MTDHGLNGELYLTLRLTLLEQIQLLVKITRNEGVYAPDQVLPKNHYYVIED